MVIGLPKPFGVEQPRCGFAELGHGILCQVGPASVNKLMKERIEEVNAVESFVNADRPLPVVALAVVRPQPLSDNLPSLVAHVDRPLPALATWHLTYPASRRSYSAFASGANRRLISDLMIAPLAISALPWQACWKMRLPSLSCWQMAGCRHAGFLGGM